MSSNLLDRKASHFVLWRPRHMSPPPRLVIGKLKTGNPPTFVDGHSLALQASPTGADLWEIPAAACGLTDGDVYHYWFEVTDSNPYKNAHPRILCTDPTAWTVDWRLLAPLVDEPSFGPDDRDPAVGEELAVPLGLLTQNRLDGLWNEPFKRMVRHAILGENDDQEPSFEWTVRKLIDCRVQGFRDAAQAVNYVTSHDVEGFRNERLYDFLNNNGIIETEKRIKLAFVCLLTAVGIPMIFAGEEFADEHDLIIRHPEKQVDPVNFDRLQDSWRQRVFDYVARLVQFCTAYDALAVNDTTFIHVDFHDGKRVLVWQRGQASSGKLAVVVANFSDFGTPNPFSPGSEYVVPNWPPTPPGKSWREISQDREVPREWVGREPLFPWEAKVYALF